MTNKTDSATYAQPTHPPATPGRRRTRPGRRAIELVDVGTTYRVLIPRASAAGGVGLEKEQP